jgi:hypothetical protein
MKLLYFFVHKAYIVSILFSWNINPKFTASLIWALSLSFNLISLINIIDVSFKTNNFLDFMLYFTPFLFWIMFVRFYSDDLIFRLNLTYSNESNLIKSVGIFVFLLYAVLSFYLFVVTGETSN